MLTPILLLLFGSVLFFRFTVYFSPQSKASYSLVKSRSSRRLSHLCGLTLLIIGLSLGSCFDGCYDEGYDNYPSPPPPPTSADPWEEVPDNAPSAPSSAPFGDDRRIPVNYMDNTNFLFGDIGLVPGADPSDCMEACRRDPNCQSWTFVKHGALPQIERPFLVSFCALKNSTELEIVFDTCCISGYKVYNALE